MAQGVSDTGPALDAEEVQAGVAQRGKGMGCVAAISLLLVLVEGDVTGIVDPILNGLITNDKICFVRSARLILGRSGRAAQRGGAPRRSADYPPAVSNQQDRSDETAMADSAVSAGHTRRPGALGSRVPGAAALDRAADSAVGDHQRAREGRGAPCA
jgi:hypothetical protein